MLRVNHLAGFGKKRPASGGGGGTITWQSTTSVAGSPGSGNASYPASLASGDLILYFVGMKPSTSGGGSVTTPSGFTLLGSVLGVSQGGSASADAGDTNIWVFYKESDGTETGTLALTMSGQNTWVAVMHRLSKSGGTWNLAIATGEQSTSGNVSVSATSDPGVQSGDYMICHKVSPTDVNTASAYSSGAFSQSGVTFGTVTQSNNNDPAGNGTFGISTNAAADMGGCIHRAAVTAGSSSGNPQFTATVSGSSHGIGPIAFVRVRAA